MSGEVKAMSYEPENLKLELTPDEVRLILFWRFSCHHSENYCPLHCSEEGLTICHNLINKIVEKYGESEPDRLISALFTVHKIEPEKVLSIIKKKIEEA